MPLTGEYEPSTNHIVREQVAQYEASGGAEAGDTRGVPVIVLTSLGARSGKLRKTALIRVEKDGQYLAVASLGGAPRNPLWYHNVKSHPLVELQDGPTKQDYVAHEVTADERAPWWDRAVAVWPDYADYHAKTTRQIPLFLLKPTT